MMARKTNLTYEEVHRRYGTHVAQRIRDELSDSEFKQITADALPAWLEARAEAAHGDYRRLLNNPLASESDATRTGECCRRWREAEDLAYLVAIGEDIAEKASLA